MRRPRFARRRTNPDMKPTRRWFQYSLRSFLVVLTALAVWLGVVVNRAREQREAVKAIEALGGVVYYDWSPPIPLTTSNYDEALRKWRRTKWLRNAFGDDYFQSVEVVNLSWAQPNLDSSWRTKTNRPLIRHLQRLHGLRLVYVSIYMPTETRDELAAALPGCAIVPTNR